MKLTLKIAEENEIKSIQLFFKIYLDENIPGVINEEFLCPFGVSSAIKRKQMVIFKNGIRIVGALRFYPRKNTKITSVYQFALDEDIRGKGLIEKMLKKSGGNIFEINCFIKSSFNKYYEKIGWKLENSDNKFNYWRKEV